MAVTNFTICIEVNKPVADVYKAVNNVKEWWQGEVEGSTEKLNDEFVYRMEDIHYSKQKLIDLIPDKKVVWLVTDSRLSFTEDKSEWTGTKIIFDIKEIPGKGITELRFTHMGLVPDVECYDACSNAWGTLVQKSLFSLITSGKGTKVF